MGDLSNLANILLKEINEIQAESVKLKIQNEALEVANNRLRDMLTQREKWLEEILMGHTDGQRQYEIYKQLKKEEIIQDE